MSDTENKGEVDEYEQKLAFLNSIAKPVASKKIVKRLFKCIKKGLLLISYILFNFFAIFLC